MYRNGVPEKVIQEQTGHSSLEALRVYERLDIEQHRAVSKVLSSCGVDNDRCTSNLNHKVAQRHSSTTSMSIPTQNHDDSMQPMSVSFGTLYGCTIIFNGNTPTFQPPNVTSNMPPSFELTETEIDEFISDF